MKKLLSAILFIGTLAILFAYQHFFYSDRVYENEMALTDRQVSNDIDLLIKNLNEVYVGKEADPENFKLLISNLEKIKNTNSGQLRFLAKIQEALQSFPDGHLNATLGKSKYTINRSNASTPENCKPEEDTHFKELQINDKKILVVTIPTFLVDDPLTRETIVSSFADKLKTSDSVILDLRGNSGGYQEIVLKMGALLWGEPYRDENVIQYYHMPISKSIEQNSKAAYELYVNWLKSQSIGKSILAANEERLKDPEVFYSESTKEDVNLYLDDEMHISQNGFAKPIYILVDSACASACELMLESLEMHPHSITIGTQTAGASKYGRIVMLTLPSSAVDVILSTAYVEYSDKRNVERQGYKPKFLLAEDEDAMDKAISMIK